MKKNKVKIILIIGIILILCLNIGVYATYLFSSTDVSYTKTDGTTISVKSALDELKTILPEHEIGSTVTVGGEEFYVLKWDENSDTVDLISKYNLNTAGNAQQNADYSTTACVFSSTNYWKSSFTSDPFNLNDFIGFTETDALGKAKSYGRSKGAVSSRLLSYEEANALKTKASSNTKIATMLFGKESTDGKLHYWLGSAYNTYSVWYVNSDFWTERRQIVQLQLQPHKLKRGSPSYNSLKISNILKLRRSFARCRFLEEIVPV